MEAAQACRRSTIKKRFGGINDVSVVSTPPASIVALSFRGGWGLGNIPGLRLGEAREGETADY